MRKLKVAIFGVSVEGQFVRKDNFETLAISRTEAIRIIHECHKRLFEKLPFSVTVSHECAGSLGLVLTYAEEAKQIAIHESRYKFNLHLVSYHGGNSLNPNDEFIQVTELQ